MEIAIERKYLDESFRIEGWESIPEYLDELLQRQLNTREELIQWLRDKSELESAISEDAGWRYIRMTCDTENEAHVKAYEDFVRNIQPRIAPYSDKLNRKLADSPFIGELDDRSYQIYFREVKKDIEMFREENIPIQTEIQSQSQKYNAISGKMNIEWEGKQITLQQAAVLLQENDRKLRESVYNKITERRLRDKEQIENLFDTLIGLRHRLAINTGFDNYRDYKFREMGRFDYKPEDCFDFHASVHSEIVPLLTEMARKRKETLGVDVLRPYDKAVDPMGRKPLKAFDGGADLLQKSINVFGKLDPYFAECLRTMDKLGHLDLESRNGKSPGGYNYPLDETGVPFIFMNATSTIRDMTTLMHEGGHAIHSFVTRKLPLIEFRHTPSEVAELASMAMELMSMDYWDEFFPNEDDLKRAKMDQLEGVIETLPWVATIDKFQHWVYENYDHKPAERVEAWNKIMDEFSDGITDWSGLEEARNYAWHKQLHLFEVPFYYIEYGFAQLGAIAVWKQYKENPSKGLEGYLNALKLGYTRSIPEVYEAAGIRFDFSRDYIHELISFVKSEMDAL